MWHPDGIPDPSVNPESPKPHQSPQKSNHNSNHNNSNHNNNNNSSNHHHNNNHNHNNNNGNTIKITIVIIVILRQTLWPPTERAPTSLQAPRRCQSFVEALSLEASGSPAFKFPRGRDEVR